MVEVGFSTALSTWKEINLSELQRSLDTTALEVVESQKESVLGRKRLAEQTKEFRKLPDDTEKLNSIKALLKGYQSEIDSLTRRSKTSDSAFLNLYKLLAEAPDPYPLLDAAVDQTVKVAEARMLESELNRLREENLELKKQVSEIAGIEDKKKKAEQRAENLEQKMDDLIADRVTQKENELNAQYDERMRNYEERERDLQRQVTTMRDQLKDMHSSNESTQAKLVDASQRQDQDVVAKLAELDLIVGDLERANERVATVERRNELLRSEIESVRSGSEHVEKVRALEGQINELESEAGRLLRALDSQKAARTEAERLEKKKSEEAARSVATQATELETLKSKMRQYADYDELKRELEIMKYVEFSGGDMEDDLHLPDPNADKANQQHGRSLEDLLAVKNKRLQEDLTRLRVAHDDLQVASGATTDQLTTLQAEFAKQKSLNERLENDLLQINNGGSGSSYVKGAAAETEKEVSGAVTPAAGNSGLAGLEIGGKKAMEAAKVTPAPFPTTTDISILPIVTSQRDRFRQRNAELEEELRKQFEGISDLRSEVKTLQADNLKLYEKVRYMQSYRNEAAVSAAGPSSAPTNGLSGVLGGRSREDDIGKYKDKYEESVNPFEAFKSREAHRAVAALNPLERGVFALTRAIVGNRRARSLFILYAGSLHLLVLIVMYNCMSVTESRQSVPIPMKP